MSPEACEILLFGGPLHGQRTVVEGLPLRRSFPTISRPDWEAEGEVVCGEAIYERRELANTPGAITYVYVPEGGDDAR